LVTGVRAPGPGICLRAPRLSVGGIVTTCNCFVSVSGIRRGSGHGGWCLLTCRHSSFCADSLCPIRPAQSVILTHFLFFFLQSRRAALESASIANISLVPLVLLWRVLRPWGRVRRHGPLCRFSGRKRQRWIWRARPLSGRVWAARDGRGPSVVGTAGRTREGAEPHALRGGGAADRRGAATSVNRLLRRLHRAEHQDSSPPLGRAESPSRQGPSPCRTAGNPDATK
jgi:hypothetical protein